MGKIGGDKVCFYKLLYDYEKEDSYVYCDVGKIGSMNKYITLSGGKIDGWEEVSFEYNSEQGHVLTDFLANVYRWLLVSNNFRYLSESIIKDQIQYLPVKIIDKVTNKEINSYSVANIVTMVDAFDFENSEFDILEMDGQKVFLVRKYVLKSNEIIGKHIFRLKDDTIPIFVSGTLKKVIEDNGLLGFDFLEVKVV